MDLSPIRAVGGRGSFSNRGIDPVEHAVHILEDVGIPESQDAEILASEPIRSAAIMVRLLAFGMLSPVDLNHQTRRKTNKVTKIWTEWKLTPETETVKLLAAQFLPEQFFGFGG